MNNIPEHILQQVADAAVIEACKRTPHHYRLATDPDEAFWTREGAIRRAVIQHALDNTALAPFLAGGIGEYTNEELLDASNKVDRMRFTGFDWLRAFLAALPRRESSALAEAIKRMKDMPVDDLCQKFVSGSTLGEMAEAVRAKLLAAFEVAGLSVNTIPAGSRWVPAEERDEAIARAEKAEAELAEAIKERDLARERGYETVDLLSNTERERDEAKFALYQAQDAIKGTSEHLNGMKAELAALKSAQLGVLRPIAEMPETVPEGRLKVRGWETTRGNWALSWSKSAFDTHFAILRLPAAEARQERPVGFNSALETWGAAEPTPPAETEPAAQVPLGPEDMKPNTWFKMLDGSIKPLEFATHFGVAIKGQREMFTYHYLKDSGVKMNESLPDTGRWDANAWRPCSKPGK